VTPAFVSSCPGLTGFALPVAAGGGQMHKQQIIKLYSLAFKQKVVSEIEAGKLTATEARRFYDIKGCETVKSWIKKMGKHHLLAKVVRIEMKDEKDTIKELKKQKKELESALAQEVLKNLALESLIEAAEDHYGTNLKKTFGEKESKKP
jgi:transposase